jgi:hypothetical protein
MQLVACMTTRRQTPFRALPHCASCGKHVRDRDMTLCTRCRLRAEEIRDSYSEATGCDEPPVEVRRMERGDASIRRFYTEVAT